MLWELGSVYAQGEEHNHIHLGCSHLGQSRKCRCTKDIIVGKIILVFFIAGSFLNISIAIVLDDKREPRVRKENPENAGDGRRPNGAGQQLFMYLIPGFELGVAQTPDLIFSTA